MNSRINHKNIVTKKNRLSNLFYVRQAVASATFFIRDTQMIHKIRIFHSELTSDHAWTPRKYERMSCAFLRQCGPNGQR